MCNSNQVRPKLLSEADLTLQKALEICRSFEQTQRQLRDINNSTEKTYAVSRSASQRKGGLSNCKYCNRQHEFSKGKYPAYGKRCRNCGKQNHFAICCKTGRNEHSSWVVKEDSGSPLYYIKQHAKRQIKLRKAVTEFALNSINDFKVRRFQIQTLTFIVNSDVACCYVLPESRWN